MTRWHMSKSEVEEQLLFQMKAVGLPEPEREYRFHDTRRWRFDFAYPEDKLAIEVHGGIWVRGRHTRGSGFTKDSEKYTEAALLGWRILHFPTSTVNSGEALSKIEKALEDEHTHQS